jgi:hypothetical protein
MRVLSQRSILVLTSLLLIGVAKSQGQACNATCKSTLGSDLTTGVATVRNNVAAGNPNAVRDLTNAAFSDLLVNGTSSARVAEAANWLTIAFNAQDMNSNSPTYGDLYTSSNDSCVTDPNTTEFALLAIGPIFSKFGNVLPSSLLPALAVHIDAALQALARHTTSPPPTLCNGTIPDAVTVSYTNMYLMNTVDQMLAGQLRSNSTSVANAHNQIVTWLNNTQNTGIQEFDSPTYSGIQAEALLEGYHYTNASNDRNNFKTALDYLGPFSRSYDFIAGQGYTQADIVGVAGWNSDYTLFNPPQLQHVVIYDNLLAGGYSVPAATTTLAESGTNREVVSRWNTTSNAVRWAQIGNNVSIGCTGGYYGQQDKLFSASLLGPRTQPLVSTIVDSSGQPYGLNLGSNGKPSHLQENLGCALGYGTALLTLDFDASRLATTSAGLFSNILFPSNATVAVNQVPQSLITSGSGGSIPLTSTDIVTIQEGNGVVGVRLLESDPVNGYTPTWAITTDQYGLPEGVARLVLTHLPNYQTSTDTQVKVSFLVSTNDSGGATEVFNMLSAAVPTITNASGLWTTAVTFPGNSPLQSLQVARSYDDRTNVGTPTINGAGALDYVLATIGTDGTVTNLSTTFWADPNHMIQ